MGTVQTQSDFKRFHLLFLAPIFAALLLRLPMRASFWLDETITAWIIKDGLIETINRSISYQGESPLYFILMFCLRRLAGTNELLLRLPSLAALIVSCGLLFMIASRLFNRQSGVFALLFFISNVGTLMAALSARPYSLALMFSLLSMLALMCWLDSNRLRYRLLYALSTLLTIYLHFLFAGILIVHFFCQRLIPDSTKRVTTAKLLSTWAWIAVLLLPALPQLAHLFTRKDSLFFSNTPSWMDLVKSFCPATTMIYLLCAAALAASIKGFSLRFSALFSKRKAMLLAIWWLAGPILFWTYSALSGSPFFVSRFFLWRIPAAALLCAGFLQSIEPAKSRLLALTAVALLTSGHMASLKWHVEDWRGAAAAINHQLRRGERPVLVFSGLIESEQPAWLSDPLHRDYLLSPFTAYPLNATAYPVPADPQTEKMQSYMRRLQDGVLAGHDELLLAALHIKTSQGRWAHENLRAYFASLGFSAHDLPGTGLVHVMLLRKE